MRSTCSIFTPEPWPAGPLHSHHSPRLEKSHNTPVSLAPHYCGAPDSKMFPIKKRGPFSASPSSPCWAGERGENGTRAGWVSERNGERQSCLIDQMGEGVGKGVAVGKRLFKCFFFFWWTERVARRNGTLTWVLLQKGAVRSCFGCILVMNGIRSVISQISVAEPRIKIRPVRMHAACRYYCRPDYKFVRL